MVTRGNVCLTVAVNERSRGHQNHSMLSPGAYRPRHSILARSCWDICWMDGYDWVLFGGKLLTTGTTGWPFVDPAAIMAHCQVHFSAEIFLYWSFWSQTTKYFCQLFKHHFNEERRKLTCVPSCALIEMKEALNGKDIWLRCSCNLSRSELFTGQPVLGLIKWNPHRLNYTEMSNSCLLYIFIGAQLSFICCLSWGQRRGHYIGKDR